MANKQLKARVKNKRDTATNWASKNPVILNGEIILVDTNEGELRAKVGDGTKTYSQLPFSDAALRTLIENKVDKVNGKGLSTNDYTAEDKLKLLGIDVGANKTVVDSELSSTSVNPVQNKVVNASISNLAGLIGDTSVASQISKAIDDVKKGTVSSATHATSADKATTADKATSADTATRATTADSATSATKATQDGNGKVISSTYETKTDAEAKLTESKSYTDTIAAGKANTSHTHAIADVTNLQTTLDAKASASSVTALQGLVGDTKVATQISTAVGAITPASIGASATGHKHTAAEITSGTLSSDRLPVVPVVKGGTGTAFSWLESAVLQEKPRVILIKEDANGSRYFDAYDSLPVANGGLGTGGAVNAQDNTLLVKQTDGNGVPFIDYTAYPKVESITIGNCTLNYDDDNKFLEFIFTSTTDTGTEV